ncbi:uncharacterized protein LOC127702347 [Mytilus californianus]|uniref:uncharacterized protein LOC127702347 n=1 Tax=Mytilus californianus TaxID=6549 RepID=UPI00224683C8|nr:uncharacterized protein LOC127702347 [Mytilus californianus]
MNTCILIFYLLHLVSSDVPKSKVSSDVLRRKVSGLKISGAIGVSKKYYIKGLPDHITPTIIVAELSNILCKGCSVITDKAKQLECKKKHCLQQTSPSKLSTADKTLIDQQIKKYIIENKGDPKVPPSIVPILTDVLCKTCYEMKDGNKRKDCIKKFCVKTLALSGPTPLMTKQGLNIPGARVLTTKNIKDFHIYFPGIVVVAELTNILCQTCSKLSDAKKKFKCEEKFCLQKSLPTGLPSADKAKIDANVKKYLMDRKVDLDNAGQVIPILTDALCKVCTELPEPKKRKECVNKHCLRTSKLSVQTQKLQKVDKPASHTDSLKSTHNEI